MKFLDQLKTVALGTLLRQIPFFLFMVVIGTFLLTVIVHIFSGQFTEADGVRILAIVWVLIAMIYWLYAREIEKLHLVDTATIQERALEAAAWERSYNRLFEVLSNIDKDILRRYGVHVTFERKRIVN